VAAGEREREREREMGRKENWGRWREKGWSFKNEPSWLALVL